MDIFSHFFLAKLISLGQIPRIQKYWIDEYEHYFLCFRSHAAILLYKWIETNYNPLEYANFNKT